MHPTGLLVENPVGRVRPSALGCSCGPVFTNTIRMMARDTPGT